MEMAGEEPDVVVGCVGGGSNFAGSRSRASGACCASEASVRFVAAEPAACPTLTRGVYRYDFGDTVGLTPLMPMYTLGHDFVPPPVHAGGLRYHGDSPIALRARQAGPGRGARAYRQNETFDAALQFARTEAILPAPEPAHAIRAVIDEAEAAKQAGEERVILFNLCGHGHFDMSAYDAYLAGELEDPEFSRPTWRPRWSGCRTRRRSPSGAGRWTPRSWRAARRWPSIPLAESFRRRMPVRAVAADDAPKTKLPRL